MNTVDLNSVSREFKAKWLAKIASGRYILTEIGPPGPELTFVLQPSGDYLCNESTQRLTLDEIEALPGYGRWCDLAVNAIRTDAVKLAYCKGFIDHLIGAGNAHPKLIKLIPLSAERYLDSLLIDRSAIKLKLNKSDEEKPFMNSKTGEVYTFRELQRLTNTTVTMDKKTAKKYIEELEKFA